MKSSIQLVIAGAASAALAGCGAMMEDIQSAMGGSAPKASEQGQAQASGAGGTQVPATAASPELIRKVQQQLQAKGIEPGPVDGIWGPETHEAVVQFQKAQGLETTGELNAQTLSALGISADQQAQTQAKGDRSASQGASASKGASGSAGASRQNPPSFQNLDANNDGQVSLAESAADTRISRDFKKADKDNDGSLSKEEFQAALKMENEPAFVGSGGQQKRQ